MYFTKQPFNSPEHFLHKSVNVFVPQYYNLSYIKILQNFPITRNQTLLYAVIYTQGVITCDNFFNHINKLRRK